MATAEDDARGGQGEGDIDEVRNVGTGRGGLKSLKVIYSYNGGEQIEKHVNERDWLIIGQSERWVNRATPVETNPASREFSGYSNQIAAPVMAETSAPQDTVAEASGGGTDEQSSATVSSLSPQALNDLLIRKFAIPPLVVDCQGACLRD